MNDSHPNNSPPANGKFSDWAPAKPADPASVSSTDAFGSQKPRGSSGPVTRVSIPNLGGNGSTHQAWKGPKTADALAAETERRLNTLSQAVASEGYDILAVEESSFSSVASVDHQSSLESAAFATTSSNADRDSVDKEMLANVSPEEAATLGSAVVTDELEAVVESILDRFPIQQSVGLIFTSVDADLEGDRIAADVADRLVKRRIGKVLLIDSHAETRGLSKASGGDSTPGLTESLLGLAAWQSGVQTTSATGLEFLSFGGQPIESTFTDQYRSLLQECKQYFQFVCVSAGSADSKAVAEWAQVADGGYLIVNLQSSSQGRAKQAADKLKSQHLEVLACIATDVN